MHSDSQQWPLQRAGALVRLCALPRQRSPWILFCVFFFDPAGDHDAHDDHDAHGDHDEHGDHDAHDDHDDCDDVHLGPRLPGSFCFSSHRSLQLNWQAHVFHLLMMVNNCENFSLRRIEWHKKNQQFQWQFEWSQIDKRKCMVSAASPQPFQLWLPKVPWPRQGSPRPRNNMRFGPRNPESQNFYTHNFHFCNISIFLQKIVILPFYQNLHVMRDALPLWQDVAKIFCSQNIPGLLDNITMTFRQTNLSVVAAKSLVLWL